MCLVSFSGCSEAGSTGWRLLGTTDLNGRLLLHLINLAARSSTCASCTWKLFRRGGASRSIEWDQQTTSQRHKGELTKSTMGEMMRKHQNGERQRSSVRTITRVRHSQGRHSQVRAVRNVRPGSCDVLVSVLAFHPTLHRCYRFLSVSRIVAVRGTSNAARRTEIQNAESPSARRDYKYYSCGRCSRSCKRTVGGLRMRHHRSRRRSTAVLLPVWDRPGPNHTRTEPPKPRRCTPCDSRSAF